jgi:hypothetical protein
MHAYRGIGTEEDATTMGSNNKSTASAIRHQTPKVLSRKP